MKKLFRWLRPAALVLAATLPAACAGLKSNAAPEQAYVLRAAPPAAPAAAGEGMIVPRLAASVAVLHPFPAPGLEGDRIVVVGADQRLDAYAASRWAGPLPDVVAALAVETLRSSGRFSVVADERAPFPADYLLRLTVRHFEAQYNAPDVAPAVRVTLDGVVGRRGDREVIGTFTAEASTTATANRLGAVVGAFEQSARSALATVLAETAAAIATDSAAQVRKSTIPSSP
jgi:cholesterol transport system auxiliary component